MMDRLIEVDSVAKSFGQVKALRAVNFDLKPGEVHALLGQNGAGKSTLIKILAGVMQKDSGQIRIQGQASEYRTPAAAREAGLAVVYQELSLVPSMTVADNFYLAREPSRFGIVKRQKMITDARRFLAEYRLPIDPTTRVRDLTFPYRQLTEIAKALSSDVRILVLDEPTSALSRGEEEILFRAVAQVTGRGVGVIYVTHRLSEVFRLSDRATVMRDGANVGTFKTSDTTMEELVGAIVGPTATLPSNRIKSAPKQQASVRKSSSEPVIELRDVRNDRLHGVDLEVWPGEIVGVAGMIGSGRTEIVETIFGLRPVVSGEMRVNGVSRMIRRPIDAIELGFGLVPEDRHQQGLVLDHSIERNLALPKLDNLDAFGLFRQDRSNANARSAISRLSIKAPSGRTRAAELSGGNQQKIVFGRWVDPVPKLLLLDEPTVGVDVGAREQIYDVVYRIVAGGSAALVISSDFAELLLLCDRIVVVADGRIVADKVCAAISSEEHLHQLVQEAH